MEKWEDLSDKWKLRSGYNKILITEGKMGCGFWRLTWMLLR